MGECFKEQHTFYVKHIFQFFKILIFIDRSYSSPNELNNSNKWQQSHHSHNGLSRKKFRRIFLHQATLYIYLPAIILHTGGPVWAIWFSATTKIFKKIYKVICIISSTIMPIKENPILLIYNYINCTWTFLRWKN